MRKLSFDSKLPLNANEMGKLMKISEFISTPAFHDLYHFFCPKINYKRLQQQKKKKRV